MSQTSKSETNRLLGYPDDARLLIINADDLGMYQDINEAILRAFKEGVVRSTSLMVPWSGARQAMELLQQTPDLPFGVHLSIICDIARYKFRPLTPAEKVPSIVDESGSFYSLHRVSEFLARAKLGELEVEFRAQIEAVLAKSLKPTHLDWHCLLNGGRADIFDMSLGLAKEYGLTLRVDGPPFAEKVRGLPANDYELLDSFNLAIVDKSAHYWRMLRELPFGLSAWAVHPGLGSPVSQAIDPDGWQVRQTDFEFLVSPQARAIIQQEGIIPLSYKPLQEVWQAS